MDSHNSQEETTRSTKHQMGEIRHPKAKKPDEKYQLVIVGSQVLVGPLSFSS
jgi:hypothetical protein